MYTAYENVLVFFLNAAQSAGAVEYADSVSAE